MKKFIVKFDETVCSWLKYISKITGESVEKIIANGIYHQIETLEKGIVKTFTYRDQP